MELDEDYTWVAELDVHGATALWLDPFDPSAEGDLRQLGPKLGSQMKIAVQRATQQGGYWERNSSHESIASSATYAQQIRVDACCTFQAENIGVVGSIVVDSGWESLQPCARSHGRCRLSVNDLTFQITVRPHAEPPPPAPTMPPPSTPPNTADSHTASSLAGGAPTRPALRTGGPLGSSAVELFEWPYESIADECARLGADGWAAVLVAPAAAHLTLTPEWAVALGAEGADDGWSTPYSWRSRSLTLDWLGLDSRAGSEMELARATSACAAHGVQIWADVQLDHMAQLPCCDDGSADGVPTCTSLGLDLGSSPWSCPQQLRFPDTELGAAAFQDVDCTIANWSAVEQVRGCRTADGVGARLRNSDDSVRRVLSAHLNRHISAGVAGFRIASAALLGPDELNSLLRLVQPVRRDIADATGLTRGDDDAPIRRTLTTFLRGDHDAPPVRPTIIVDVWPQELLREPEAQPTEAALEHGLTSAAYLGDTDEATARFATDTAWALQAGATWTCRALPSANASCEDSLRGFTGTSVWAEATFVHSRWTMRTDQPPGRVSRSLNRPFLDTLGRSVYAPGTAPIAYQGSTYAQVVSASALPAQLHDAANAWLMALPGGPPSLFSSYERRRGLSPSGGRRMSEEALTWVGPPRLSDGRTAPVDCNAADATPTIDDDGLRWACEHRSDVIGAMPRWRREVEGSVELQHLIDDCGGDCVGFARDVERQGRTRRHGWILTSRAADRRLRLNQSGESIWSGLPPGRYCNAVGGGHAAAVGDASVSAAPPLGALSGCAHVVDVDWRGRFAPSDVAAALQARGTVVLSTGLYVDGPSPPPRTLLSPVPPHSPLTAPVTAEHEPSRARACRYEPSALPGLGVRGMWLLLLSWVLLALLPLGWWSCNWRRTRVEVRLDAAVCALEHSRPSAHVSGVPEPGKYGVLIAALEHVIPSEGVRVVAGGLGNVCALYVEKLPCRGKFVFARVGGVDYGSNWKKQRSIIFRNEAGVEDKVSAPASLSRPLAHAPFTTPLPHPPFHSPPSTAPLPQAPLPQTPLHRPLFHSRLPQPRPPSAERAARRALRARRWRWTSSILRVATSSSSHSRIPCSSRALRLPSTPTRAAPSTSCSSSRCGTAASPT